MSKCGHFFILDDNGNREFIKCNKICPYYHDAVLMNIVDSDSMSEGIGYCTIREARIYKLLDELHHDHIADGTVSGTVL